MLTKIKYKNVNYIYFSYLQRQQLFRLICKKQNKKKHKNTQYFNFKMDFISNLNRKYENKPNLKCMYKKMT